MDRSVTSYVDVEPVWRADVGLPLTSSPCLVPLRSAPAVVFGYGGRSGSHGGIVILDIETGAEIYRLEVGAGVEGGAAQVGQAIVFGDQQGCIHCLDLDLLKETWTAAARGAVAATPLVDGDTIYVGTTLGEIVVLDAATGQIRDTAKLVSNLVSSEPVHVVQDARPVSSQLGTLRDVISEFFNLDELEDLCFDLDIDFDQLSGSTHMAKVRELIKYLERRHRLSELLKICEKKRPDVLWARFMLAQPSVEPPAPAPGPRPSYRRLAASIVSTPAKLLGNLIVVGALDGGLYSYEPASHALSRLFDAGASIYTAPVVYLPSPPDATLIIVGTSLGVLVAVNATNGKEAWRQVFDKSIRATPTLMFTPQEASLYVGGHDHNLHVVDPLSGAVRRSFAWERSIVNPPLILNGRVIFADSRGRVVSIDEANRNVVWHFDAEADKPGLDNAPAAVYGSFVVTGGRLICGAYNGRAYALTLS